ncbi:LYR motif-containing protein 1 isoform X2 [Athene cunicularia]|uniref:LYR motif-containing protein 1 isoform X2 n=1 Tax=Athene cunicularia TaxID=194338 RepID=UPI000EF6DD95|nr:LYR motif-containing protein 1 isoform X2 [Athene cunicularia]
MQFHFYDQKTAPYVRQSLKEIQIQSEIRGMNRMAEFSSQLMNSMTPVTRQEVLSLYRKIFQIAKKWQSASGQIEETIKEKEYIKNEARTLFRKNKDIHLPPMGLAHKQGRTLRHQEKLRKISKPIYLKSHDEVS